jgi:hypothetical protein
MGIEDFMRGTIKPVVTKEDKFTGEKEYDTTAEEIAEKAAKARIERGTSTEDKRLDITPERTAAETAANSPMYGIKGMRTDIEKKLFNERHPQNEDLL